jgi:hypothetical protein
MEALQYVDDLSIVPHVRSTKFFKLWRFERECEIEQV